jgi:hypothetical protein
MKFTISGSARSSSARSRSAGPDNSKGSTELKRIMIRDRHDGVRWDWRVKTQSLLRHFLALRELPGGRQLYQIDLGPRCGYWMAQRSVLRVHLGVLVIRRDRLGLCGNPNCRRPFVAEKKGRGLFCSPKCSAALRIARFRERQKKVLS